MAIKTTAYLKTLWIDGFIPVTQDYTDLIDTLHSLDGTSAFTDNGDSTYTFDDGSGTPFTIDADLSNYVTLDTSQTITGEKTHHADILIEENKLNVTNNVTYTDGSTGIDTSTVSGGTVQVDSSASGYQSRININGQRVNFYIYNEINNTPSQTNLIPKDDNQLNTVFLPTETGTLALIEDIPLSESTNENVGVGFTDFENEDTGEKLQVNGLIRSNTTITEIDDADDQVVTTKGFVTSKILNITKDGDKQLDFVSGVIRNTNGVWDYVTNSTHIGNSGLGTIETFDDYIKINYAVPTYSRVFSASVTPDETYAVNGVTCGASVGVGYLIIYLNQNVVLDGKIYHDGVDWVSTNPDVESIVFDTGYLTVTHSTRITSDCVNIVNSQATSLTTRISNVTDYSYTVFNQTSSGVIFGGTSRDSELGFYWSRACNKRMTKEESAIAGSNIWLIGLLENL